MHPILLPALVASFLAGPPVVPLEPADRTEWPLAPGEVRRHVVSLEAGQFVRVTVMQAGIDVTVRIHAPDGTAGDVVDANEGPRGWEPASLVAETNGDHVIEIAAAPTAPEAGRYVVDADSVRPAEPRDLRRLVAEQARARAAVGLGPRAVYAERRLSQEAIREAIRQLPLAAGIFHALGETCWEADSLTFFGLVQGWMVELPVSLDAHERALALWERCGDRYRQAEAHNYAAEGYVHAMQYSRAARTYERGLALAREEGARDIELLLLNNAAGVYNLLGDTDGAIRHGEQVLPEFHARGIRVLEGTALHNLAKAHLRRGELQRAADRALEAHACFRDAPDPIGVQLVTETLGEVYLRLGEPLQARRFLLDALPPEIDADPLMALSWTSYFPQLVRTYEEVGDRQVSTEPYERMLALNQLLGRAPGQAAALINLARLHLRDGSADMALEAAHQAAELLRASGDRFGLAGAVQAQGDAFLALGDLARARDAFQESLHVRRAIGDPLGEALSLHHLARLDRQSGDPHAARARLQDALRLIEGARTHITSPDLRSTWLANMRAIHEAFVDTLMDLHRRDPRAGWDAKAFEASESSRARSLLDLLAESRAEIRAGVDPELLARERSLRERLGARLEAQVRLLGGPNASQADEVRRDVQLLSVEYEDVRGRLRAASPQYAALTQPEPMALDRVRSEVLDADTLLLEYGLGPERSYLWVVGRERFDVHELPGQAAIEAQVRRARAAIDRRDGARTALAELARLLLGPARGALAGQRLLVVADGPLHHVPFGALPDRKGRPLVATHEVVNAPSASVVALLRKTAAARPLAPRTIAVLADPVFDRADSRVDASAPAAATGDRTLERATRDFGFEGGRLPRLPFTRREARSILALAPGSRLALDFEASRATVVDPELKEYRYLHFATHGLLNDVRPELSGLVLSLVDRDGGDRPGLLTAPDVFNLQLGADLVVLSGCRTALGKEIRGEGLIGLTRAFMYAGVPRVVASLWPVDDRTTAELMKTFYEGILGPQKLPPAAALRRAQARMASDPRWSAPYYWAGFQLQGDWR